MGTIESGLDVLDETPTITLAGGVWTRTFGERWTSPEFRAPILAWLADFKANHNWVTRWYVCEEIQDDGITVKVPRTGDAHMAELDPVGFAERPGPQVTRIFMDRQGATTIVLGITWPHSHLTPAVAIQAQLDVAKTFFETTHASRIS